MRTKIVEIRDHSTTIPALAICPGAPRESEEGCLEPNCHVCRMRRERDAAERWAWEHAGFGKDAASQSHYVLLYPIDPGSGMRGSGPDYDPYRWENKRTMATAHRWLTEHFAEIESGAVVDVRFILGEQPEPAPSERIAATPQSYGPKP